MVGALVALAAIYGLTAAAVMFALTFMVSVLTGRGLSAVNSALNAGSFTGFVVALLVILVGAQFL